MASLPTRTTASFDAIKPVSSLVLLDDEFNQYVGASGIFNGGTTGAKLLIKSSDAADPPVEIDQIGAGPLAEWKQNGALKTSIANSGQIVSAVTTGTSPLSIASTTLVTNLNADLLDGKHAAQWATQWSANWFIQDPSTFPANLFNLVQKASIPALGAFTAIDGTIICNTGTASGSFTVEIRKHPLGDQATQTVLLSMTITGAVAIGQGLAFDINPDVALTANDWIYPILTSRSSPLQRDVSISLRGFQTLT